MNKCKICGEETERIFCAKCEYKYSRFSPCKNCPNRHPCCHSECDKYALFKEVRNYRNERLTKERIADKIRTESIIKGRRQKIMKDYYKRNR